TIPQGAGVQAQALRRLTPTLDRPPAALEDLEDQRPLVVPQRLRGAVAAAGVPLRRRGPERLLHAKDRATGEDHRPLADVLQFADVPRPLVRLERGHGGLRDLPKRAPEGPLTPLHIVPDEQRDVLAALPERGHLDGEHVQTVVEIRPEPAVTDV